MPAFCIVAVAFVVILVAAEAWFRTDVAVGWYKFLGVFVLVSVAVSISQLGSNIRLW